jgi:dual specificity phosphatase 12
MTVQFDDKEGIESLRRHRLSRAQEVIPGLWLGSQEALFDVDLLERNEISHIITVMSTYVDEAGERVPCRSSKPHEFSQGKMIRLIIPVEDSGTENLLQHFPRSTEFITSALQDGGKVLVHCQAGASRSPTVVAAYLMEIYRASPAEAVAKIRESRRLIQPIRGFWDQLQVYEACRYRPSNQPVYLHWKLRAECETEIELPQDASISRGPKPFAKIPLSIPYVVTEIKSEIPQMYCTSCMKALAPQSSLLSKIDDCYLAQPMDWMSPEFDNREHDGHLSCTQCETLVGEYNWNGKRDASGQWIAPAFVLYRNLVSTRGP